MLNRTTSLLAYLLLTSMVMLPKTVHANQWVDGVIVSGGEDFGSNADLTSYRVSLFKNWNSRWFNEGDWYIGGYYDLSINHWKNHLKPGKDTSVKGSSHISAIAFSPVFRVTRKSPWFSSVTPFAEAGIGLSYLSGSTLRAKKR